MFLGDTFGSNERYEKINKMGINFVLCRFFDSYFALSLSAAIKFASFDLNSFGNPDNKLFPLYFVLHTFWKEAHQKVL